MARSDRLDLLGRTTAFMRSSRRSSSAPGQDTTSQNGVREYAGHASGPAPGPAPIPAQPAGVRLQALLDQAEAQDAAAGRAAWLAEAVGHLVPDEARILSVLGEQGELSPGLALLHIYCVTATGLAGEPLLENLAYLGPETALALPQLMPCYVCRLLSLDLVEIGGEDPRHTDDYPALLAHPHVLSATTQARDQGMTPRVMRHSLHLSALGRELWSQVAR